MVCYNSLSHLPPAASILCSSYILCSFSCCAHMSCAASLIPFMLYPTSASLYTAPLLYSFSVAYYHLLCSCISSRKEHYFHVFITSPLLDHPGNSSSPQLCTASRFSVSCSKFCMSFFHPVLSQVLIATLSLYWWLLPIYSSSVPVILRFLFLT
jgi:hypothetical protein